MLSRARSAALSCVRVTAACCACVCSLRVPLRLTDDVDRVSVHDTSECLPRAEVRVSARRPRVALRLRPHVVPHAVVGSADQPTQAAPLDQAEVKARRRKVGRVRTPLRGEHVGCAEKLLRWEHVPRPAAAEIQHGGVERDQTSSPARRPDSVAVRPPGNTVVRMNLRNTKHTDTAHTKHSEEESDTRDSERRRNRSSALVRASPLRFPVFVLTSLNPTTLFDPPINQMRPPTVTALN